MTVQQVGLLHSSTQAELEPRSAWVGLEPESTGVDLISESIVASLRPGSMGAGMEPMMWGVWPEGWVQWGLNWCCGGHKPESAGASLVLGWTCI